MIGSTSTHRAWFIVSAGLLIAVAAPSLAGSPAAIPHGSDSRVRNSFERFADEWMQKVRNNESAARSKPTVRPGARQPMVTYRGYGEDFAIELRPTGHPSAPYVGLLRYSEHVYSCETAAARKCRIASTIPVTEIFRYQDGDWKY